MLHFDVGFLFGLTRVRGEFRGVRGWARLDASGELRELEVTVDAGSLSTGIARRDLHLRSRDFLHVEAHPTFAFRSTGVTPLGEGRWRVEGNLSLRGVTAPTGFDLVASPGQERRQAVSVGGVLRRSGWGVTFGLPLMGEGVRYEGMLEAVAQG